MPEDVAELEQYIKEQGLLIIAEISPSQTPLVINSLIEPQSLSTYLVHPSQIDLLKIDFIEAQNKFWLNELWSPVIEFSKCVFSKEQNTLRKGRLYFEKAQLSDDRKNVIFRNQEFIKTGENLFKWYKKHFKNSKINSNWTTLRVAEWIKNENGRLLIN